MTSGTFGIITEDNNLIIANYFSGDMYLNENGWGSFIIKALQKINTEEEFERFFEGFKILHDWHLIKHCKENNQKYEKNYSVIPLKLEEDYLVIENKYLVELNCEYMYIKNMSKHDLKVEKYNGSEIYNCNSINVIQ